jgi:hypothetical protein
MRQHSSGSGARRPRVVDGAGITIYVNGHTRRASQHGGHPAVKSTCMLALQAVLRFDLHLLRP